MRIKKSFWHSLAVFCGTVIGVGIFSLPYVASRAGFLVALFYFLMMGWVVLLIQFIFGEVVIETEGFHRLPGYVENYLGKGWKKITLFVIGIGFLGTLLAYLIVGGSFLNSFLSPFFGGSELLYSLLFFGIGSYLIFRGQKSISGVELGLLFLFFIILFVFLIKAFPFIEIDNFKTINLESVFLPYGVTLFALWGTSIIPEIKEMVGGSKKKLRRVIISGTIIAILTYLIFTFLVLGVSGMETSPEAISGFVGKIGNGVLSLVFVFGAISVFTSFITLGLTFKKVLWYDFGLSPNLSWLLVCFIPLILFLLGVREFIGVIGFTGALMLGGEGVIIFFLYKEFLLQKFSKKPHPIFYGLALIFVLGIVFEIIHFIF